MRETCWCESIAVNGRTVMSWLCEAFRRLYRSRFRLRLLLSHRLSRRRPRLVDLCLSNQRRLRSSSFNVFFALFGTFAFLAFSVFFVFSAFSTLRSVLCVLYSAFCTLRSALCVLHFAFCILRSAFCVLHSAFCVLRSCVFVFLQLYVRFLLRFRSRSTSRTRLRML